MACVKMWEYVDGCLYLNCRYVFCTDGAGIGNTLAAEYLAMWIDQYQPPATNRFVQILIGLSSEEAFKALLRSVNAGFPNWNANYIITDRPMFNNATKAAFNGLSSWMND